MLLDLNWDISIEIVKRFSGDVVIHRKSAITPKLSMMKNVENRTEMSCIPHGVKFNSNPRRETRAIEKPKLNPILSNVLIPLQSVFIGKSMKMNIYPGIKRRKGNPIIIRNISSMLSRVTGSISIPQRINRIISIGNFLNWWLMILA